MKSREIGFTWLTLAVTQGIIEHEENLCCSLASGTGLRSRSSIGKSVEPAKLIDAHTLDPCHQVSEIHCDGLATPSPLVVMWQVAILHLSVRPH